MNKCSKTISGKHYFSIKHSFEWGLFYGGSPFSIAEVAKKACRACGIIDDRWKPEASNAIDIWDDD